MYHLNQFFHTCHPFGVFRAEVNVQQDSIRCLLPAPCPTMTVLSSLMKRGCFPPLVHLHLWKSSSISATRHSMVLCLALRNCTVSPTLAQNALNSLSKRAFLAFNFPETGRFNHSGRVPCDWFSFCVDPFPGNCIAGPGERARLRLIS